MDLRKAISPILATVILIAVTLVIAIGVIGWIMGVWGTLGGPTESLVVTGGRTGIVNNSNFYFSVTIVNKGSATATLSRIEVVGVGSTDKYCKDVTDVSKAAESSTGTDLLDKVILGPGSSTTIVTYVSASALATTCFEGATYNVNVYTKAGNVYTTVISISKCQQQGQG